MRVTEVRKAGWHIKRRPEYGKLGEVTKETRTLTRHIPAYEDEKSAVMEYVSDYLGCMQRITYPDREVVTYGYDSGGQVCSIKGVRDGQEYTYVADIGYDEYGQRVYMKYGNGVETNYTYDKDMRWLKHIDTANTYGKQYQNIEYSFDDVGNVEKYTNDCMNGSRYRTEQTYTYDALYQLISATGTTEDNPYAIPGSPDYSSTYTQDFSFDTIGNMTYKKSEETITPAIQKKGGDDLNYEFTYEYDADYAHRLTRAGSEQKGWRYYTYDANGNVTSESDGVAPDEETTTLTPVTVTTQTNEAGESVYEADYAWAWPWSGNGTGGKKPVPNNKRRYEWNSRNLLMRSVTPGYDTRYVYAADGNRAAKWTLSNSSETLYFNTMWTWHTDTGLPEGQYSKHIYLGETRVVTKQTSKLEASYGQSDEWHHRYYYHPDHLGSAQLITDYEGNEYQRIEYTPYGELWVEKKTEHEEGLRYLPYKFTAKEQDEETGLYYYGARYLDAKYSRWMSADPAVGEYMSGSSAGGGIYNTVNFSLYHYAGNNPVKYIDPTGMSLDDWQDNGDGTWTVKSEGAKLWDVWGANWQEESGFDRDPRTLQVGETVGKKNEEQQSSQQQPDNQNSIAAPKLGDILDFELSLAEPLISQLGLGLTMVGKFLKNIPESAMDITLETLLDTSEYFAKVLGTVSVGIDAWQYLRNPSYETARDFSFSVIGMSDPFLGALLQFQGACQDLGNAMMNPMGRYGFNNMGRYGFNDKYGLKGWR